MDDATATAPAKAPETCPVCLRDDAGCRVAGDLAACYRRESQCPLTDKAGRTCHVHHLAPEQARRLFAVICKPGDLVIQRQIETWKDPAGGSSGQSRILFHSDTHHTAWEIARLGILWDVACQMAERDFGNQFFGVCPRVRGKRRVGGTKGRGGRLMSWDHACQIRVVRCLWADLDRCNAEQALERCRAAGLPLPTVIVSSGNGVHLYWVLAEPYLIDDAGVPPAFCVEDVLDADGKPVLKDDGRRLRKAYFLDADGETVVPKPDLSAKAEHAQDLLSAIAGAIGGDHAATDISRLLRLPGTFNRKDQRNGKPPKPCELVEWDPSRLYPVSLFEEFAASRPPKPKPEPKPRPDAPAGGTRAAKASNPASFSTPASAPGGAADIDDDTLIRKAMHSKGGESLAALWRGDMTAHGDDHSKADLALCCKLAFWCGPDPARIDRLFRLSGLVREKWTGRADYRNWTITRAIEGRTDFYKPSTREQWPDVSLDYFVAMAEGLPVTRGRESKGRAAPDAGGDAGADDSDASPNPGKDLPPKCREISRQELGYSSTHRGGGTPACPDPHEKYSDAGPHNPRAGKGMREFSPPRRVENCDRRPCPARQWVQLASRRSRSDGRGLGVRCRRWSCVVCLSFQKALWQGHLWDALLGEARPLYLWRGTSRRWPTAQRAVQRAGGDHCRVALPRGRLLVVTTAPLRGAAPVGPQDAADAVVVAIAGLRRKKKPSERGRKRKPPPKAKPRSANPVSSSRGWALPRTKTGEWWRVAFFKDPKASLAVLRAMGVRVVERADGGVGESADGVQGRAFCTYPCGWGEDHIRWANGWAAAQTVPPGWKEGDLPADPEPLGDDLVSRADEEFFDGLLLLGRPGAAGSAPPPTAPPEPAPPPAPPPAAVQMELDFDGACGATPAGSVASAPSP